MRRGFEKEEERRVEKKKRKERKDQCSSYIGQLLQGTIIILVVKQKKSAKNGIYGVTFCAKFTNSSNSRGISCYILRGLAWLLPYLDEMLNYEKKKKQQFCVCI